MTWLKLDDGFHIHPKVAPLSDRAFRLHVTAQLEASRQLTNGNIGFRLPASWPSAPRGAALKRAVAELVEAGLWEPVGSWGWQIHDFLDWNPHSRDVLALREKRQEAGKLGGKRSAEAKQKPKQVLEQTHEQMPSKTQPRSRSRSPKAVSDETASPPTPHEPELETTGGRADWSSRLVERQRPKGEPPRARHDPLSERVPFARWFPTRQWLDWFAEVGITDRDYENAHIAAKSKLPGGLNAIDWWDLKMVAFIEVEVKRKAKAAIPPGAAEHYARGVDASQINPAVAAFIAGRES